MSYFYQGAAPCLIFDASGKDPAKRYRLKTSGAVRRGFNACTKGYIWCIEGGPATRLSIGESSHARTGGLRIVHKTIVFQLLLPPGDQRPFALELLVSDTTRNRRRILLSTAFASLSKTPLHAQVPLGNALNKYRGSWFHWVIDMTALVQHAFGKSVDFHEVIGLSIGPSCMLRTVFSVRDGFSSVPENCGGDFLSWRPLPEALFPASVFSIGPSMTVNGYAPRVDNQNSSSSLRWKRRGPASSIHIAFGSRCETKTTTSAKDGKHATRSVSASQRSTCIAASKCEVPVSAHQPNASADYEPEKETLNVCLDQPNLRALGSSPPKYTTVGTTAAGASLDFQGCNSNLSETSRHPCGTLLGRFNGEEEKVTSRISMNTALSKEVDHVALPAEEVGQVESIMRVERSPIEAENEQLGSYETSPGAVPASSLQSHEPLRYTESRNETVPSAEIDAILTVPSPVTEENRPGTPYQSGSSSVLLQSVMAPAEPSMTLGKASSNSSHFSTLLSTTVIGDETMAQNHLPQSSLHENIDSMRAFNANAPPTPPLQYDVQALEIDMSNHNRKSCWKPIEAHPERADTAGYFTANSTSPNMLASTRSCCQLHRVHTGSIQAPTTVDSQIVRSQERMESTDATNRKGVTTKSKEFCDALEISEQAIQPSVPSMGFITSERRNSNFNQRIMLTASYGHWSSVNSNCGDADDPPSYTSAISDSCYDYVYVSGLSTTHSVATQRQSCNDTTITRHSLDPAELQTPEPGEHVASVGAENSYLACSTVSLPAALEEQSIRSNRTNNADSVHEASCQALGQSNDVECCSMNSVATCHELLRRAFDACKSVEVKAAQATAKRTGDEDSHDTEQTTRMSKSCLVGSLSTLNLNDSAEPPPAYDDVTAVVPKDAHRERKNGETVQEFFAHESTKSAPATMVALAERAHRRLSSSSRVSVSVNGAIKEPNVFPSCSSCPTLQDGQAAAGQRLRLVSPKSSDQPGHLFLRHSNDGKLEEGHGLKFAKAATLNSVELLERALPASHGNIEEKAPSTLDDLTPLYSVQESGRQDRLQLLERKMNELAAMENSYREEFGSLSLRSIPCQPR